MASAAVAGFKGKIYSSTSTSGTLTKIGEVRDFVLTLDRPQIDAKSRDSGENPDWIMGIETWGVTAEYLEVSTDAFHRSLADVAIAGTKGKIELYPTGSSSHQAFTGEGFLTGCESGHPNEDAIIANVTFAGAGALSRTSTG